MKLYTLAEIAQELDLPESTLRYYRKTLGDRIPAVGTGRQARFPEEAIEVFRKTATKVRENGKTLQNALVELIDEGEVATAVVPTARAQQPQTQAQQPPSEEVLLRSLLALEQAALAWERGENAITASLETIRENWREEARVREEQHTATLNALRAEARQREEALMAHLAALQAQAQRREEQARRQEKELTARLDALQETLERPWWDRWRRLLGRK
jgi:hypothetical protein